MISRSMHNFVVYILKGFSNTVELSYLVITCRQRLKNCPIDDDESLLDRPIMEQYVRRPDSAYISLESYSMAGQCKLPPANERAFHGLS